MALPKLKLVPTGDRLMSGSAVKLLPWYQRWVRRAVMRRLSVRRGCDGGCFGGTMNQQGIEMETSGVSIVLFKPEERLSGS